MEQSCNMDFGNNSVLLFLRQLLISLSAFGLQSCIRRNDCGIFRCKFLSVQMAVFIAVSFICILCLRPISMKFFKPRNVETNAQSLVGKEVLITCDVDNIRGLGEAS